MDLSAALVLIKNINLAKMYTVRNLNEHFQANAGMSSLDDLN